MINSILLGEVIHDILIHDEELLKYVNADNIFPLVSDEGTKFPFIVYGRDSLVPNYISKDGNVEDNVNIHFYVCSTSYKESCFIANALRAALEFKHGSNELLDISSIRLDSCNEECEYGEGWIVYIQDMMFSFVVK